MKMDSGSPAEAAQKLWNTIRALIYTLRKNLSFSSQSLLIDIQLLLKRTKSFSDLLLRHYSSFTCRPGHPDSLSFVSPSSLRDVEFSCSNTPNHFPFKNRRAHHLHHHHHHKKNGFHVSRIGYNNGSSKKYNFRGYDNISGRYDNVATVAAVQRVLEMLNRGGIGEDPAAISGSVAASPMILPGFGGGRSPAPVRQLRITDSPFPVKEEDAGDGGQVDVAAEEFIRNFYRDLRLEKCMSPYYGFWG